MKNSKKPLDKAIVAQPASKRNTTGTKKQCQVSRLERFRCAETGVSGERIQTSGGGEIRFKFAVNRHGRNKNWNWERLATKFQDKEGTIRDVIEHVKSGHAILAGLLNRQRRSRSNVIGAHWILLDIDNSDIQRDENGNPVKDAHGKTIKVFKHQLTLDEALEHPFIKQYCSLIYTTASHKPDWHKFRLIFLLPQYVEGADTVEVCTRFLMKQLPHDPACKDSSRVFYGNTEADFPLINPSATLPQEWVQEAIVTSEKERIEYQQRVKEIEERRKNFQQIADCEDWDTDKLIQEALKFIPPRLPGSNNYDECRLVLMALHSHYGEAEATQIAESWSPSIPGTTWNIPQKMRSFRRNGTTIGSLFHVAKQYGFKFPQRTKEGKKVEAKKKKEQKKIEKQQELERLTAIRDSYTKITRKPDHVVNVPHMGMVIKDLLKPGAANIIVSDTGTGKSESIRPIIKNAITCYSWHNRVSLARSLGAALGLVYKDEITKHNANKACFCNPSSYQFSAEKLRNNGILLLDEADQVFEFNFQSLCNKDGIRPLVLSTLEAHIAAAISGDGMVIIMSADIGQKEIDYIEAIAPEGTPINLIVNTYQADKPVVLFNTSDGPEGTIDDLIQKLKDGIPCFVVDDLKNGLSGCKSVAEYARQQIPEIADQIIEIHADNADAPSVKEFWNDPNKESEKYLLIATSPSIVSGINLTNKRFANGVFVLGQGILLDREIKQALNRIRGQEYIHMWVDEEGFPVLGIDNDLVAPDEIKAYYQRNYEQNAKHILAFKSEYEPLTNEWTSPHFELFCKNLSYRIITMKYLRHFTKKHLEECGYIVEEMNFIPEGGTKEIKDAMGAIWGGIEINEAEQIAAARILSDTELEALENSPESIPSDVLPSYKKTKMLKQFGEELIEKTLFEHSGTKQQFSGYAGMALKNKDGSFGRKLDAFYLLIQDESEAISRDYSAEYRQIRRGYGRFAGDIRWSGEKRKYREYLGLKEFLDPEREWRDKDFQELIKKARSNPRKFKDVIGFSVEKIQYNGQIVGQLFDQLGLSIIVKPGEGKEKIRKIDKVSWDYAQMYITHREKLKAEKEAKELEKLGVREALVEIDQQIVTQPVNEVYAEQLDLNSYAKSLKEQQQQQQPEAIKDTGNDAISQVDAALEKAYFGFDLKQLSIEELWSRRINRSLLLGQDIAKGVYQSLHQSSQQLLNNVWSRLTPGVQGELCQLFA
ncbi:hypothetical protein NIES4106_62440 (plasmid) [Fischerella sp. NIES-4106]|nr:hypothetical protein NIES4106_62440 [Fischerella sp. NIES-4106]